VISNPENGCRGCFISALLLLLFCCFTEPRYDVAVAKVQLFHPFYSNCLMHQLLDVCLCRVTRFFMEEYKMGWAGNPPPHTTHTHTQIKVSITTSLDKISLKLK